MKPIYIIFALMIFLGCRDDQTLFKNSLISGIAVIHDPILQLADKPAEGIIVYLTDVENDSSKYIYSTKTSAEGRFSFSHRPADDTQLYLYTYYLSNGVTYTSKFNVVLDNLNSIVIEPRYKPGIKVFVQDTLFTPLFNVNVCLYSSLTQSNSTSCEGSIRSVKTNDQGVVFFENLQAGKYFVRINDKIGSQDIHGEVDKQISGNVIDSVGVIIRKKEVKVPGIKVYVTDSLSTPLANVNVCFFTSEVLALNGTCENSILTQKTDALGVALFKDLKSATYFFLVNDMIGHRQFNAFGKTAFTEGSMATITMQAKKKADLPPKGLSVTVIDSLATPLANVNVCIFTSEVLAQKRECIGNIASQKTDSFGKTIFQNLPSGTYFLVVNEEINNREFNALGEIFFASGGLQEIQLMALKKPN